MTRNSTRNLESVLFEALPLKEDSAFHGNTR